MSNIPVHGILREHQAPGLDTSERGRDCSCTVAAPLLPRCGRRNSHSASGLPIRHRNVTEHPHVQGRLGPDVHPQRLQHGRHH